VDDLLDVSRITRGKVDLRLEPVDVSAAVARAVETSRPHIDAQGHELLVALPGEPLWLQADPARLAQVLANLLNNAAKYTERGGRIWLSAGREGPQAVVRVRDNGTGIAPEVLPRIFDLFAQAEGALERSQGGLGIGLTLVRGLVEMHGGVVAAHSAGPGQGTEFVVRLPLRPTPPLAPGAVARARGVRRGLRVLVVDDNRDAAESVALLLRLWGHATVVAYDGPGALELAGRAAFDAALLDLGLPGMTGHEVGRRLRASPGNERLLLIAMTGYGQEEDQRRSHAAGFDHHLVKPVDPATLEGLLAPPS
jgi:CheY-like chemotaxis protein